MQIFTTILGVFNSNIRFLRKKLGLSQQKLAEELGEKRGKIAAYEEAADARPDFYKKLIEKYRIDLHLFLTEEMTEDSYLSFFLSEDSGMKVSEPSGEYLSKSEMISYVQRLKNEPDPEIRLQLADRITTMIVNLIEENGNLHKEMLEMIRNA